MITTPDLMTGTPDFAFSYDLAMDALSDVLRVFSLDGGVFLDARFTAPWAVRSQVEPADLRHRLPKSAHIIAYHYVAEGRPMIRVGDAPPVVLGPGEIVILPRNDEHVLSSGPGLAAISAGPLVSAPAGDGLARIRHGGGGDTTRIVCGYIGCESGGHPLIDSLPAVLRLNVRAWEAGAWVEALLGYAAQESASAGPGSESSLAKVSELLFVEAVRRHLDSLPDDLSGWLAGLRDAAIGRALALLHERPAHPWTVDELATAVHLSRSAFAERFTTLVGVAPLGYLGAWRMQLAKRALRQGRTVAQVAGDVGYASEAAFSRAFKREVGLAPKSWKEQG